MPAWLHSASCCSAVVVTTIKKRLWTVVLMTNNESNCCLGLLDRPSLTSLSVPCSCALAFLVSNGTRLGGGGSLRHRLLLRSIVDQWHGCAARWSLLPEDRWCTTKLDTRLHLLQRPHACMVLFLQLHQARAKRRLLLQTDLQFLHSWTPTAEHWECPTAISNGSTANAAHFSLQEGPSMNKHFKWKRSDVLKRRGWQRFGL